MMLKDYWMGGSFGGGWWLAVLAIWEMVWKGMALWKAAQRKRKEWFVALLIINTMGILPILYLYVFDKDKAVAKKSARR